MELRTLKMRPKTERYPKVLKIFLKFEALLKDLSNKKLSDKTIDQINMMVYELNNSLAKERVYHENLKKAYSDILKMLKKEENIVPKDHYRNLWMALGISTFGIPIGVAFGIALGNMAFLVIGLPIGMAVGLAIGTNLDKKALKNNKQLNIRV